MAWTAVRSATGARDETTSLRRQPRWCPKSGPCSLGLLPSPGRFWRECPGRVRPASRFLRTRRRETRLRKRLLARGGASQPSCARETRSMTARPILSTQAMKACEQAAIDGGTSVETLMERAGAALAEAAYRFAGPLQALVLCGPGNNGGDGYVAARHLAARGLKVRVAAPAEPKSDAAKWARSQWNGEVE